MNKIIRATFEALGMICFILATFFTMGTVMLFCIKVLEIESTTFDKLFFVIIYGGAMDWIAFHLLYEKKENKNGRKKRNN